MLKPVWSRWERIEWRSGIGDSWQWILDEDETESSIYLDTATGDIYLKSFGYGYGTPMDLRSAWFKLKK
jgi:hypothetical protein